MVHGRAHVSIFEEEASTAWVSRSLVEVGVDKNVGLIRTVLLESRIQSFNSEINNLFGRDLDGNGHLLNFLNDVEIVISFEFFVNIHGRRSEVRFVQEIVEWHEKHAIIGFLVANFLEQLRSPFRVIIGPRSIVALFRPWISDLGKFYTFLNFDHIEQGVSMCILQSIGSICAFRNITTGDDHGIVFFRKFVEQCELIVLKLLGFFVLDVVRWFAGELPETFEA